MHRLGVTFLRFCRLLLLSCALSSRADMVGHWKLDEVAGSLAADSVHGHHAAWQGPAGRNLWVPGRIGNAALINDEDGEDEAEHFLTAQIDELNGSTALTISLWFNQQLAPNDSSTYNGLFMTRTMNDGRVGPLTGGQNWGLALENSSAPRHIDARIDGRALDGDDVIPGAPGWHHVALVWSTEGKVLLYLDGSLHKTATGFSTTPISDGGQWWIGGDECCNKREFTGALHDIALWNEALTAAQIRRIYTNGLAGVDAWTALYGSTNSAPATLGDYYVAPWGDDTNPGTLEAPFATIQKAANVAVAGDVVVIRGGTYREKVRVPRSGTATNPITFINYGDEIVVVSACDPVRNWVRHSGDIWKAVNSWNMGADGEGNTLFVNGRLQFEAAEGAEDDPLEFSNWGHIPKGRLTSAYFTASDLAGWGDDFWNGAKVRVHVNDWTIATRTVADYRSSDGRVWFDQPLGVVSQKQTLGYTIYGTIKALDRPGEWFKDVAADTLYYHAAPGENPNAMEIEFKARDYTFNVRGRDYIHIQGLTLRGGSIQTSHNTDHNVYQGLKMYGYDRANFGRFWISGSSNALRDCEVFQTWGGAATVSGTGHRIVNNYFHDIGYNGTSRVLGMNGEAHLFSRNTVRKIARSFLDGFPYRSEFSYNLFEDGANLSWDTGFFDGDAGVGNGGGCIVHHNVFRNTLAHGIYCAFYSGLDLSIHHNIIHDITPFSLRAGFWNFVHYYHNTIIGPAPTGPTVSDRVVESSYNNNLQVSMDKIAAIGVDNRGNHDYAPSDFVDFTGRDFRLAPGSGAIDKGILLRGINDDYRGAAPDAGALEFGEAMWAVGHDFVNPPDPAYTWRPLLGMNLFDDGEFRRSPVGWTYVGTPTWYDGNAWNTGQRGLALTGRSFQLQPGEGMRRTITGLKPNTRYRVGVQVRLVDQRIECERFALVGGSITSGRHRGEDYIEGLSEGEWVRYDNVDFGSAGRYDGMELTYTRPPGTSLPAPEARLEVRLESPSGPLLAGFQYNEAVVDSWFAEAVRIPPLAGCRSICFVGKGPGADSMRLASLRLLKFHVAPDDQVTIVVRNHGGPPVSTRVGQALWTYRNEEFSSQTGPPATSVELFIQNDGAYDAYMDRLVIYEAREKSVNAALGGTAAQSSTLRTNVAAFAIDGVVPGEPALTDNASNSWWQVDLGRLVDLASIRITAPISNPSLLSNFRVSVWATDPRHGGHALWQQDYLRRGRLAPGETIVIKGTDRSIDGRVALEDVSGRFVRVQLLGLNALRNGILGLAEVEVRAFDEDDLMASDADVRRTSRSCQATFSQIVNIGELMLVNTNGPAHRELGNFKVSAWDRDPAQGGDLVWEKSFLPSGSVAEGGTFVIRGDEVGADGMTRLASVMARAIRVENNGVNDAGNRNLPLLRVVLHSPADAPPFNNLAQHGVASQSSTNYAGHDHAPMVINGIINPGGDFTHTRNESRAWWQVDLGRTSAIDQIVIFNRRDAAERIGTFRVSVWDRDPRQGGTELWGRNYSYYPGD